LQTPAGERILNFTAFLSTGFPAPSESAVSPHQSLRKKVGVMATRAALPYLRVAVCCAWITIVLLAFAALGSVSSRSVIFLLAAALIPPSVFLALWNDGPPATVAELLRTTEDRR
jgi:hypothetical protein